MRLKDRIALVTGAGPDLIVIAGAVFFALAARGLRVKAAPRGVVAH